MHKIRVYPFFMKNLYIQKVDIKGGRLYHDFIKCIIIGIYIYPKITLCLSLAHTERTNGTATPQRAICPDKRGAYVLKEALMSNKKKWILSLVLCLVLAIAATLALAACDPAEKKNPTGDGKTHTMTFETNGGDETEPIKAKGGADISKLIPEDPVMDGVYFGGWYLDDDFSGDKVTLPDVMPNEDVTYYAKWVVHFTIVPQIQSAATGNYEPAVDKQAGPFEAEPGGAMDVTSYIPELRGYERRIIDQSDITNHLMSQKDNEIMVYYLPKDINVAYDANLTGAVGDGIPTQSYKFGQNFTIQPNNYKLAGNRFAGWSLSRSGNGRIYQPYEQLPMGSEEAGLPDEDFTLFAVWDKGYESVNLLNNGDIYGGDELPSMGKDFVFASSHTNGKAYLARCMSMPAVADNYSEIEGTFNEETGEFVFLTERGNALKGKVYPDGHFSFESSLDKGTNFIFFDGLEGDMDASCSLEILDDYGAAKLTVGSGKSVGFISSSTDLSSKYAGTLRAGEYEGALWYNNNTEEFAFAFYEERSGARYQVNVFMALGTVPADDQGHANVDVFQLRGEEVGAYVGASSSDPIVILDGYGKAYVSADDYFEGYYEFDSRGCVLVTAQSESGSYAQYLVEMQTSVRGYSDTFLPRYDLVVGDLSLYGAFEGEYNGASASLYLDGMGYALLYNDGGEIAEQTFSFAQGSMDSILSMPAGLFLLDRKNQAFYQLPELPSIRSIADPNIGYEEDLGLLLELDGEDAYLVLKNVDAYDSVVQGSVSDATDVDAQSMKMFTSTTFCFVFSWNEEAKKYYANENGVMLGGVTFSVDGGEGELTFAQDGALTYTPAEGNKLEAQKGEYLYINGLIKVSSGEDFIAFLIVDLNHCEALSANIYTLYMAGMVGEEMEIGLIAQSKDNGYGWMLALGEDGEQEFYGAGVLDVYNGVENGYYFTAGDSLYMYCLREAEEGTVAIFPNVVYLYSDTFDATEDADKSTLKLDYFGNATYVNNEGEKFEGLVETRSWYYFFSGQKEGGEPLEFFFELDGSYYEFAIVQPYELRIAMDPMNWDAPEFIIKVETAEDGTGHNVASIYEPELSNDTYVLGDMIDSGYVEDGETENYFKFVGSQYNFEFYLNTSVNRENGGYYMLKREEMKEGTFEEDVAGAGDGAESVTAPSIQLDKFGNATFTDEKGVPHEGTYTSATGWYEWFMFVSYLGNTETNEPEVSFVFAIEDGKLVRYDVESDEIGEVYSFTYSGQTYYIKFPANASGAQVDVKLQQVGADGKVVDIAAGKVNITDGDLQGDGDVYCEFVCGAVVDGQTVPDQIKNLKFKLLNVSGSRILLRYDSSLDFTLNNILGGNFYLFYYYGATRSDGTNFLNVIGSFSCNGYLDEAVLDVYDDEMHGAIVDIESGYDESGSIYIYYTFMEDKTGYQYIVYAQEDPETEQFYYVLHDDYMGPLLQYFPAAGSAYFSGLYADGLGMLILMSESDYDIYGFYDVRRETVYYNDGSGVYRYYMDVYTESSYGGLILSGSFRLYITSRYIAFTMETSDLEGLKVLADDMSVLHFDGYDTVTLMDVYGNVRQGTFTISDYTSDGYDLIIVDDYYNQYLYHVGFGRSGAYAYRMDYSTYANAEVVGELDIHKGGAAAGYEGTAEFYHVINGNNEKPLKIEGQYSYDNAAGSGKFVGSYVAVDEEKNETVMHVEFEFSIDINGILTISNYTETAAE